MGKLLIGLITAFTVFFIFQNCAERSLNGGLPGNSENSSTGPGSPPVEIGPKIVAGYLHACSLQNGALKCWGSNLYGVLGINSSANQHSPQQVIGMETGVSKVALGSNATCAIKSGALYCWGHDIRDQLGTYSGYGNLLLPPNATVSPEFNQGVTDVSAGYYTICAIKNEALYCWGWNDSGQLGNNRKDSNGNSLTSDRLPQIVTGMDRDVIAVDVAPYNGKHVCAIKRGGALYCWGSNIHGELGDGTNLNRPSPVMVSGMDANVTQVSTGGNMTCAIKNSQLYCWGYNGDGRLGVGSSADTQDRKAPTQIVAFQNQIVQRVECSGRHCCALVNNSLYCWGWNGFGNVGNGTITDQFSPVAITGMDNVVDFAVGGYWDTTGGGLATYALIGKSLYSWGRNNFGQLGIGTFDIIKLTAPPSSPSITFP